jgi:two-component system sensor histidine kinase CiaH
MFRSATLKMSLWYVAFSMALSLAFSAALYLFSTHELQEGLSNQYREIVDNDHDRDNQNAITKREFDARSTNLRQELIYFNILVLIGTSGASYMLARRTLKPIEEAHEQQLRFTAEASHELRTPLTGMKADTEATLMQKNADIPMLRHALEENIRDIERLEDLTNHLLELALYQNKNVQAKTKIVLSTIVNSVVSQYQSRISGRKLTIDTNLDKTTMIGDKAAVLRLVTIVLDNAIKYSKDGGRILISVSHEPEVAKVSIRDDGVGIATADLPHIFERFYRSNHGFTSQEQVSGYGLGLSLAKEIVAVLRGSIDVVSKQDEGTTVVIKLPIAPKT